MSAPRRKAGKRFGHGKKVRQGRLRAAVELGKRGGKKGGPARAKSLTSAKKSQIAAHAAKKRWGKSSNYQKPDYYKRKVRS